MIKSIIAAFMMYSRIPMPDAVHDEDDMHHAIMFLPLVGAVIAVLMYIMLRITAYSDIPVFVGAILAVLVPLAVTGGFHVDGFMDTVDALRSYQSRERKLEIMSDPHTGSFAIIELVTVIMLSVAAFGIIIGMPDAADNGILINISGTFVISRGMAALTSIRMKKAKQDGLLVAETEQAGRMHMTVIILQMAAALAVMAFNNITAAVTVIFAFAVYTVIYRNITRKNFGGVTGDTAGYYVTVSETVAVCAVAALEIIIKIT